jgi:hypothetical protein
MVANVCGDKKMKRRQIYEILKKIKDGKNLDSERHFKPKKTVQTGQLNTSVANTV